MVESRRKTVSNHLRQVTAAFWGEVSWREGSVRVILREYGVMIKASLTLEADAGNICPLSVNPVYHIID